MSRLKPIAAPLAAAIALRMAVLLLAWAVAPHQPQFREPDSVGYLRAAGELVKTGRFSTADEPELERTPGYPLLLTPGVVLEHVEAVTIALQMALSCLTVWLVFQMALVVYSPIPTRSVSEETRGSISLALRLGVTAAWFCALEPVSIIYTSKLLTETLFTTLLAAALWCLARYCAAQCWRDLLLAAAGLAAATYVRPISYYLPLWIAPVLFLALGRSKSGAVGTAHQESHGARCSAYEPRRPRRAIQAAAFVALSMALVGAWQIRNWYAAGYAGFAAIADVNLYYYEALGVIAEQKGVPPSEWDAFQVAAGQSNPAAYLARHPAQRDWPPARRYVFLRREAVRIIRGDPWCWLRLHLRGVGHTLFDSGRNAWLGFLGLESTSKGAAAAPGTFRERLIAALRERPLVLAIHSLLAGTLFTYLGLALLGLIAWRPRTPAMIVLLAAGFYLLMLSGGAAGYHRFRLPLVPIISLFAAAGFTALRQRLGR